MHLISNIKKYLARSVGWLTVSLLGWMVLLAFLQLLFRWMKISGIDWADVHLRQLVLWLALLGGSLAAAQNRHIRIDFAEHFLKGKAQLYSRHFINIVAAGLSGLLTWYSISFIQGERTAGNVLARIFFGWSLPLWMVELIIPVGFFLIAVFFLLNLIEGLFPEASK